MEAGKERSIDESFKKPGSIPFKWEIQPGIPKPHPSPTTNPLPLPPKLRSRPSMLPPPLSQSSNLLSHSASASRAFPSQGCFTIPSIKRRDDKKGVEPIASLQRRSMSARFTPLFSSTFLKSMQAKDDIKFGTYSGSSGVACNKGSI